MQKLIGTASLGVLLLFVLSGCLHTKVEGIADDRIGRIKTYNDAKLGMCLKIAGELEYRCLNEMRDGEGNIQFCYEADEFMKRCRPELLIERAQEIRGRSGPPPQTE